MIAYPCTSRTLAPTSSSSLLEVFPTRGRQFTLHTVFPPQINLPPTSDLTNPADLNSLNPGRHPRPWWRREQQFVILATIQCEIQIDLSRWPPNQCQRNRHHIHFCAHPAFLANVT